MSHIMLSVYFLFFYFSVLFAVYRSSIKSCLSWGFRTGRSPANGCRDTACHNNVMLWLISWYYKIEFYPRNVWIKWIKMKMWLFVVCTECNSFYVFYKCDLSSWFFLYFLFDIFNSWLFVFNLYVNCHQCIFQFNAFLYTYYLWMMWWVLNTCVSYRLWIVFHTHRVDFSSLCQYYTCRFTRFIGLRMMIGGLSCGMFLFNPFEIWQTCVGSLVQFLESLSHCILVEQCDIRDVARKIFWSMVYMKNMNLSDFKKIQ